VAELCFVMVVGSRLKPLALGCSGVDGLIRVNLHVLDRIHVMSQNDFEI